jgi:hypothetical protein
VDDEKTPPPPCMQHLQLLFTNTAAIRWKYFDNKAFIFKNKIRPEFFKYFEINSSVILKKHLYKLFVE